MKIQESTTIAAIATPLGVAGVGIVRLSGPASLRILSRVFCRYSPVAGGEESSGGSQQPASEPALVSHRFYHGYIVDASQVLDEVLVVYMRAPNSYTAEDVVEINAHGGPVLLQSILSLVLRHGAEMARPGEFTRRAFQNGRIDLTQAEAVADIIEAGSEKAVYAAADQMAGRLREEVGRIKERLAAVMRDLSAAIDFCDQTDAPSDSTVSAALNQLPESVLQPIQALVDRHDSAWYLKGGVRVALAGRPNAGKSTLLNHLLGCERAIVTPTPGTTRDILSETVVLQGVLFVLSDTAGIGYHSEEEADQIGMQRARKVIDAADVVLYLVDLTVEGLETEVDLVASELPQKDREKTILVANKIDLPAAEAVDPEEVFGKKRPVVKISALTGEGVPRLTGELSRLFPEQNGAEQTTAIPNPRHKQALLKARQAVEDALSARSAGVPVDMLTIDLREAVVALDEILGEGICWDVMESVFEKFCVGK